MTQSDPLQAMAEPASAYLGGWYRKHLEQQGCAVPSWAWINQLAHGSRRELAERTEADHGPAGGRRGPEHLIHQVACHLIGLDDDAFRRLQVSRLQPLEQRMLELGGPPPRDEDELATAIVTALTSLD